MSKEIYDPATFRRCLSQGETNELFGLARRGDKTARNDLIECNMMLVLHCLKSFKFDPSDRDDLVSAGMIGLISAVDAYDINSETPFPTYACICIKNKMRNFFCTNTTNCGNVMSLDDAIYTAEDGDEVTILDTVQSDDDTEKAVMSRYDAGLLHKTIKEVLSPIEIIILAHRYGLFGYPKISQTEVGKMFGITKASVSRREALIVKKLRKAMTDNAGGVPR